MPTETELAQLASSIGNNPELYQEILKAQAISLVIAELKAETSFNPNPEFDNSDNDWSIWSDGEVFVGSISASSSSPSRKFNNSRITIGIDKEYKQDKLIGFAVSAGRDDADIGTDGSKIESDNFGATLYTTYKLEGLPQIEASLGYSDLTYETKRIDGSETLTGERNGHTYSGSVRLRQFINYADLDYSYYGGFNLADIKLETFDETGGTRALRYFDQDIDYQELDLGAEMSKIIDWNGFKIRTYGNVQYSNFLNKSFPASMRYLSQSNIYSTNVSTELKESGTVKFGVNIWKSDDLKIDFAVSRMESIHSNGNDHYVNSGSFGLNYRF